jgi:hypothetical protein
MTDRFEELMHDAAHTYRRPPEPDFDAMWQSIEAAMDKPNVIASIGSDASTEDRPSPGRRRASHAQITQRLAIAATLVIGIALGRASMSMSSASTQSTPSELIASNTEATAPMPYEQETSKYLGQTAALLIALPSEVRAGRADEQFVNRAGELLSRTRLLIDSPAASDPRMRDLLEDLELVLAQVVRLQNDTTSRTELDLISRALEQRDVIPRLRTAVADITAN